MAKQAKTAPHGGEFRFKVRGPRDFYGGLALIVLATVALWASSDLPGQQGFTFGSGTAPRIFAMLLAFAGAAVAVGGLLFDGPPIERYAVRGPAYVLAGILAFAVMIQGIGLQVIGIPLTVPPLGLVAASFCAFMISIFGSTEMRWLESTVAAAAMTGFCVGVFAYLLQLPFQLWPGF
jgi:putative tricarboxylic transport membrane protein